MLTSEKQKNLKITEKYYELEGAQYSSEAHE